MKNKIQMKSNQHADLLELNLEYQQHLQGNLTVWVAIFVNGVVKKSAGKLTSSN